MTMVEPHGTYTRSPLLLAGLVRARAFLADDADADEAFTHTRTDLAHFPFMRAQASLAYGASLRRQRRTAESRGPLREARDVFDALGAAGWAERARMELRASGETIRQRARDARGELSTQELQIALMAADGLTNRQIGERLFLSSRTIGSHLYRIFPKLGIRSRSELGWALGSAATVQSRV
jgi:DNA-binding NarL/FixJ family response regulator